MITRTFQTIRCFFWKLKNRFKFKIKTIPAVIDAGDLVRIHYVVYVDKNGELMFQTRAFSARVLGVCEWQRESKRLSQINEKKVVLDVLINPLAHVEG